MADKALRILAAAALAACVTIPSLSSSRVADRSAARDLTVHEWGTFTSVAGPDGQPVEWLPLTGYHRPAAFRGALPRRAVQMRSGRNGAHGNAGHVLLQPARNKCFGSRFFRQRLHYRVVSACDGRRARGGPPPNES